MDNLTGNGQPYMPQRREGARQKRKDRLIIALAIPGALLSYLLVGPLSLAMLFYSQMAPREVRAYPSPDGQYVAYVYEMDPGAMSGYIYHLSILEADTPLGKRGGNTYKSHYGFTVEWQSDSELHVNNLGAEIYKQKTEIDGITVTYDTYLDD